MQWTEGFVLNVLFYCFNRTIPPKQWLYISVTCEKYLTLRANVCFRRLQTLLRSHDTVWTAQRLLLSAVDSYPSHNIFPWATTTLCRRSKLTQWTEQSLNKREALLTEGLFLVFLNWFTLGTFTQSHVTLLLKTSVSVVVWTLVPWNSFSGKDSIVKDLPVHCSVCVCVCVCEWISTLCLHTHTHTAQHIHSCRDAEHSCVTSSFQSGNRLPYLGI